MANWVNGSITPFGTKEKIKAFTDYMNSKEEWKDVINRNCPPEMKENEIHIYDNDVGHAIDMAEEMEEKFRDTPFRFFVCDEMNGIGWGINYMAGIETCILCEERHNDEGEYWLEPTEITSEHVSDEYILKRKEARENENQNDPEPF